MLGLALGLSYCQGGVLLIDDIDTGLHYTVMERMWKLIFEASKQLNVQVFATTHSRDCIDALASISRDGVFEGSEVMIHRIEAGKSKSISYSEATIKAVAEFGNEVR
jgi:AAA15 family ATPase/GTPase